MSVMIGVDPHKGSHTAVVINGEEQVVDQIRVKASVRQVVELQEWAAGYPERFWAVESARGLGYLLSQQVGGSRRASARRAGDDGIPSASPRFE